MNNILQRVIATKKLLASTQSYLTQYPNEAILHFGLEQDKGLYENMLQELKHYQKPQNIIYEIYGEKYIGPIDPKKIAEYFGIQVNESNSFDLLNIGRCWLDFEKEDIVIEYKPVHIYRNRFTVAHELGHIFLHMFYKDKYSFIDTREIFTPQYKEFARGNFKSQDPEELEADKFAGRLLLPKHMLDKLLHRASTLKTSLLRDMFKVSKGTIFYALLDYGYLNHPKIKDNL